MAGAFSSAFSSAFDVGAGGTTSGDGTATGTSTVTGVGASTAAAGATTSGTCTIAGVGASSAVSPGSSDGTSTVTGVGASTAAAVASASGTSTVTAASTSTAASPGSADGTSTATAASTSTAVSPGAAAGTSTVTGVGASTAEAVASADGTSTASGVSDSSGVGSAAGTSTATGVGASSATTAGTSTGTSTVAGIGASTASAIASASGTSTVTGVASSTEYVGTAAGTSTAEAFSVYAISARGAAEGTSTTEGYSTGPAPVIPVIIPPSRAMNCFGTATKRFPIYDNWDVLKDRLRFDRERIPRLEQANSFYAPVGRYPARGWILMSRRDYAQLDKYSTTLQLSIDDPNKPDNVATLKNLAIVQAQCVTSGLASDPNALYLVDITDGRGLLANEWFTFPLTAAYNIRAPAYPQGFYPASMNGGTTYTWAAMLQNMWEQMTPLGTWPDLPTTPAGVPEGWWFPGVPAWPALCDVLEHLGMVVAYDPTANSPYTIVQQNVVDSAYQALVARYRLRLEDDLDWVDYGAGRVPRTIKVLFRRRNAVYGTEETVRYDSPQWSMTAYYTVSVSAPAAYASAAGTHFIWSDFTVRYDVDNNPLAADTATATAIAQQRVDQYFSRLNPGEYRTKTYTGALPFKTGSQVDGVRWAYRMRGVGDGRIGWQTQTVYGPCPPWQGIWGEAVNVPTLTY